MSEGRNEELSPELRHVQEAVQQLPGPRSDPAFRAALRRRFIQGTFAPEQVSRQVERRPAPWIRWWRWALVPAAAAAALLLLFLANRGPSWSIHQAYGTGVASVDGETVPVTSEDRLGDVIRSGSTVVLGPDAGLELRCGDLAVIEVTPGSHVTLPSRPGRWLGRTMAGRVGLGEMRVMTGPGFSGRAFHIFTPEGRINLTGTVVSAYRNEELTCVCILEGEAMVGRDEEHLDPIHQGMRKVMFSDSRPSMVAEIVAGHRDGLVAFRERHRETFAD